MGSLPCRVFVNRRNLDKRDDFCHEQTGYDDFHNRVFKEKEQHRQQDAHGDGDGQFCPKAHAAFFQEFFHGILIDFAFQEEGVHFFRAVGITAYTDKQKRGCGQNRNEYPDKPQDQCD